MIRQNGQVLNKRSSSGSFSEQDAVELQKIAWHGDEKHMGGKRQTPTKFKSWACWANLQKRRGNRGMSITCFFFLGCFISQIRGIKTTIKACCLNAGCIVYNVVSHIHDPMDHGPCLRLISAWNQDSSPLGHSGMKWIVYWPTVEHSCEGSMYLHIYNIYIYIHIKRKQN